MEFSNYALRAGSNGSRNFISAAASRCLTGGYFRYWVRYTTVVVGIPHSTGRLAFVNLPLYIAVQPGIYRMHTGGLKPAAFNERP
jgi:hypothetical protein